jgi:hypothetical protein
VAALRRVVHRTALTAALAAALFLTATVSRAADPTPDPAATQRPPTCAERYPAEGPAGVDLRLGCIVGEVVGLYVPGQSEPPPPLSTYAILVGVVVAAAVLLAWIGGRLLARRAGRRLAPVMPDTWWVCDRCRSVNDAGVARCYACGGPRGDGPMMRTDEVPSTPQGFGSTRKRG